MVGRAVAFVGVVPGGVPPQLPGACFEQKLFAVAKAFEVEELLFNPVVDGFDISLVILFAWWNEAV